MDRARIPCLASLPVVALGSLVEAGRGHLERTTAAVAVLAAPGVLALVARAFRGDRRTTLPAWPFALLPPLGLAVHEHLERLGHGEGFPTDLVAERAFLGGLVLESAVGLAGWAAVHALSRCAGRLGEAVRRALARDLAAMPPPCRPRPRVPAGPSLRRKAPLALGIARRGPPLRPA